MNEFVHETNRHPIIIIINNMPQLEITDERGVQVKDKFYYVGSTIELKCYITKVPQPSQFIVWRHETTSLNYDTSRGGIRVSECHTMFIHYFLAYPNIRRQKNQFRFIRSVRIQKLAERILFSFDYFLKINYKSKKSWKDNAKIIFKNIAIAWFQKKNYKIILLLFFNNVLIAHRNNFSVRDESVLNLIFYFSFSSVYINGDVEVIILWDLPMLSVLNLSTKVRLFILPHVY
ncbi:hypothetical protein QTP88_025807 [Uroleucon formosanum]